MCQANIFMPGSAVEAELFYVVILANDDSFEVIQISSYAGVTRREARLSVLASALYALRALFDRRKVARV